MKIYETKEVAKTEQVVVKIICDVCETEIASKNEYYEVEFTQTHDTWIESFDSISTSQVCSSDCLRKKIDGYITENDYDSMSIDVEKKY